MAKLRTAWLSRNAISNKPRYNWVSKPASVARCNDRICTAPCDMIVQGGESAKKL